MGINFCTSFGIIMDSKIEFGKQPHEYKDFLRIWSELTKNDNNM